MSRFDEVEELTPDPEQVYLSYTKCEEHGFNLISWPRDAGSPETPRFKCPLKSCGNYVPFIVA